MKTHGRLYWIVLTLCLLSFSRGIYELGEQSLWWDEGLSHFRATRPFSFILSNRMSFTSGTRDIPVTPDNHPPLYFVLLRITVLAAGDSEFALRFLSLGSGVLIVPLLYQSGKRLFSPRGGALGAMWGAVSPLYLWAQQEARPYALATLLATVSFYSLIRVLEDPPPHIPSSAVSWVGRMRGLGWQVLYVVSTAAMLTTHYQGFLLLPAHGVIWLITRRYRDRRVPGVLLVTAVIVGGLFLWGLRMMPRQPDIPGYRFVPLATMLHDVLRSFALGISGTRLYVFQWVSVGLALAALTILVARRQHSVRRHSVYVLLCFALPVAEMYALSYVRPAYMNVRHLILSSPFYYLLLAAGISQASRARTRVPLGVGAGVLLVGVLLSTYVYFCDPRFDKEDHRQWGRYLSDHVRPDDLVLINPGAVSELYFYYTDTLASWSGFPPLHAREKATVRRLAEIVEQNERVWVAHSSVPEWANPGNLTLRWLEANATRIAFASFAAPRSVVQAHAFRLKPPLLDAVPDTAAPVALDFDGQMHLLGLGSPMESVVSGHTLQLSLYWLAARPLGQDYRVTLSLTRDTGFSWASADYAPCAGTYPTSEWPAGRIVRDDVDVDIGPGVPPGRYRLNASVYPADRGTPALAARDLATGSLQGLIVPIGEIEVVAPQRPPADRDLPIAHEIGRRYGELALLGHNYDGGTYRPGDMVLLDAYWRALRTPRKNPVFGLQLTDESGKVWGSREIEPVRGYPPVQWSKGEVVRGQYRFRVPIDTPPGQYSLCLARSGEDSDRRIAGVRLGWPWATRCEALGTLAVRPPSAVQSFQVPPMEHELRANLGDQVELLGYDLASDTVRPGQTVSCTLYWRGLQEMNQDYTVFNHLVAPDGQTWGQWDNQPQRGTMPTTRWAPGQVVADPYQIPVPADAPAGMVELRVGMYDLLSMTRIPVHDESGSPIGDHVAVTQVAIVRP